MGNNPTPRRRAAVARHALAAAATIAACGVPPAAPALAAPHVQLLAPNGGERLSIGAVADVRWTTAEPAGGTVDISLSRTGPGGPYEPVATGLEDTGAHAWTIDGPPAADAVVRIVVRDAAGDPAEDASDLPFTIEAPPPFRKLVVLRADSAAGAGPYAGHGGSPWVDLTGAHDAYLHNFLGNASSGWKGNGTPASPHRLEFAGEDPGINSRVWIPAGSVPELQQPGPVTVALWFKTGYDGPRPAGEYEYLFEWVQPPDPEDPDLEGFGVSIAIEQGKVQVYADPWVEATAVEPNTWYHVAVVKDSADIRLYVDGERRFTGSRPHRGIQQSEIVIGCSVFRGFEGFAGEAAYGDYFSGAIAQVCVVEGAINDSQAREWFEADRALYRPAGSGDPPPPTPIVSLRAARADGAGPYPAPGAGGPWVDLAGPRTDAELRGFAGDSTSGWLGDGSTASPFRLEFDGADDCARIAAGSVDELQAVGAVTAQMWIRPGPEAMSGRYQYLLEWLQGFWTTPGMSLAMADGRLLVYLGNPHWEPVADVFPDVWHHVTVVKAPGFSRVYVDGARVFEAPYSNLGDQASELVLGASTWRGSRAYGDYLQGAIADFDLWNGALADSQVFATFLAGTPTYFGTTSVGRSSPELALRVPSPHRAGRSLRVSLALPSPGPARLELIDVAGRRLASRDVGTLGPGRHAVDLGEASALPAGMYFVRLSQAGRAVSAKAAVIR